ncbi:MAG: hypothetical protein NT154_18180, partial [Verrucomicrobia bacterium]|nr:hypothetical protein [Verrucomicrobiota bacterium]
MTLGRASRRLTFATTPVAPPTLGNPAIGAGGVQFGFSSVPGVTSSVLGTTNVMLPFDQWQNLGHPMEGPAGHANVVFAKGMLAA